MIGTPSIEEIYQITKTKSREVLIKFGKQEPKSLEDLFPSANPEGINYLFYS